MAPRIDHSPQTLAVFAILSAEPAGWRHGYDIAKETGLKSGTLYPILMRLADRGLLEARWEAEQPVGRPRRHLYRLTNEGLTQALEAIGRRAAARRAADRPASRGARGVLAGEV